MSATDEQIARLRRMTAEPTADTYDDRALADYIEAHPLRDADGRDPGDETWADTYDFAAAAADVWDEQAAGLIEEVDANVDGASLARSQAYQHARAEARRWRARSHASPVRIATSPPPGLDESDAPAS